MVSILLFVFVRRCPVRVALMMSRGVHRCLLRCPGGVVGLILSGEVLLDAHIGGSWVVFGRGGDPSAVVLPAGADGGLPVDEDVDWLPLRGYGVLLALQVLMPSCQ